MPELFWDQQFKKTCKKWIGKHKNHTGSLKQKLTLLKEDPFHPQLKTHSLSGTLSGLWSARINYEYRLVFKFLDDDKNKILLIDIGKHDDVY